MIHLKESQHQTFLERICPPFERQKSAFFLFFEHIFHTVLSFRLGVVSRVHQRGSVEMAKFLVYPGLPCEDSWLLSLPFSTNQAIITTFWWEGLMEGLMDCWRASKPYLPCATNDWWRDSDHVYCTRDSCSHGMERWIPHFLIEEGFSKPMTRAIGVSLIFFAYVDRDSKIIMELEVGIYVLVRRWSISI